MTEEPKCSPGRIQFLSLEEARRKRSRNYDSSLAKSSKHLAFDSKFDSKFDKPIPKPSKGDEKHCNAATISKQKRVRTSSAMDTEDSQSKRIRRPTGFIDENAEKDPNPFVSKDVNVEFKVDTHKKKKYYTEEQVNKIVNNALKQREEELREEYNKILNERLAEQFENFSRFNQDYVYRQLNSKPCSYVS